MKSFKTNLTAVILITVILLGISCKKDSPSQTKTTQEKLLGKWNLISGVDNDYYSGSSHITTTTFLPGDYMEFKSDGTASNHQSGSVFTYDYGIVNDSKIWIGLPDQFYDLKILTETDLQFYQKNISGADYYESTTTLKK